MKKRLLLLLMITGMAFLVIACASDTDLQASDQEYIETTLNLANNTVQEWTYSADSDAWVLTSVSAVAYPELPDQQGVSVCVPGAYVVGIDTDSDGQANVSYESYTETVNGSLIINYDSQVTNSNGQVYTAKTAPVILNTGAAGYASSNNSNAATSYASEGYINVSCGNRGKQDTVTDEDGNTTYTGDAPSCLVDQKAAARYVKYNILLGNLPGSVDYFVSTGGSGGGAHATMFAATSNNPDYYDYEIEAGAVGVYRNEDGTYSTTVSIDDTDYEISDGAWGCVAYSAITSLYEGDIAMAFEYYMDSTYDFNTSFQAQMAEYLSTEYMDYINDQNLSVDEAAIEKDLNGDGDLEDTLALTIEYDPETYPETNGYYGTYLDLYLQEFTENLQWYLDNLDYAEGWTWFDESGTALSDEAVAAMTSADKAQAFIEGRYAKSAETGGMGGPGGDAPSDMTGMLDDASGEMGDFTGTMPDDTSTVTETTTDTTNGANDNTANQMEVGTPDTGTTQSADSQTDSANYGTYEEMVVAYEEDIASIEAGDEYGNNIISLYNPLNYIGVDDTENPTWTRIVMGASEGDMSMLNSLNLQIAWLNAGVDSVIEWQWDGGHVPSEIFGNSLSLYVDEMYGEYVDGAVTVTKAGATQQTENGTEIETTGTDISSWVNSTDLSNVSFTLADAVAYRTAGASKAIPGFDVIDYGQEDYVFGDSEADARHWDTFVLEALNEYADQLEPLFNAD
ncbi:hypothetical protein Q5O24_03090 [Eubacteriaceae bacterium ES3]|nr:hypothetical protein Q5O24_03090 [Eubacteriaceae bacterium ES3]